MLDTEKKQFAALMTQCWRMYGQPVPDRELMAFWWGEFERFDWYWVEKSFRTHMRQSKFVPTIAEIGSGIWHDTEWILKDTTWANRILAGEPVRSDDARFDSVRKTVMGDAA